MTGIQTGGIWILRHELLGQLSDFFSAHQGKAPCPCWESTVPRLGKQRAHFSGSSVKCIDRKKNLYYDKNKAGIIYLCSDQTQ